MLVYESMLEHLYFSHHDKCLTKWIYVLQGDEIRSSPYGPDDGPASQTLASIVPGYCGRVPGFRASPHKSLGMRLSGSPHFVM